MVPLVLSVGLAGWSTVLAQVLLHVPAFSFIEGVKEEGELLDVWLRVQTRAQRAGLTDHKRPDQSRIEVPLLEVRISIFFIPSSPLLHLQKEEEGHPNLVHGGVVSPSFAVKFAVCGALSLGYPPVISPHLSGGQRLSGDSRRGRRGVVLGGSCPLVAVVDTMKMEGVWPGCLVLKDDLKQAGKIDG